MEQEISKDKEERFKGLHTMVPAEVFNELTDMCRERASFTGKWDYGTVLRELLTMYKVFWRLEQRIDGLDNRYGELLAMLTQHEAEHQKPAPEEVKDVCHDEPQLLGRRRKKIEQEVEKLNG